MILEDEISLAPSVTTIYAMGDFPVYTNTADIVEDKNNLPNLREDDVSLAGDTAEFLPCYKTNNDHDSKREKDSLITMLSHDHRFSSQTPQQGQTDNGVETTPKPSHQQATILHANTAIPIHPTSSVMTCPENGYVSNTTLSSSNDGYTSSDRSGYRQYHVLLSSSVSEYQPAPVTAVLRSTPSLSELSFNAELQEEQEVATGEARAVIPPCGDGYIHTDLSTMMPDSNVDSGYKQADIFLSPEVSGHHSPCVANILDETASLDGVEAKWPVTGNNGIPNSLSRFAGDKHTSQLPREKLNSGHVSLSSSGYLKDDLTPPASSESMYSCNEDQTDTVHLLLGEQSHSSRVSLDSSGYLRDNLTVPPSFVAHGIEEDLDTVHLLHGEESRDGRMSLDSSGYLKDNLTSPPSRGPHRGKDDLDTVNFPDGTLDCMRSDADLQTSVDLLIDGEFDSVCHPDLTQYRMDGNGYFQALKHSRQDDDDHTHTVMQSVQGGDGYIDSGLELLPTVAESANDLNPCYDSDVSKEETFLKVKEDSCNVAKCLTRPGSGSDLDSSPVFSDSDDYIKCDVQNSQPAQSSVLRPTCCRTFSEVSDNSGYVVSSDFSSSIPKGIAGPLCPTTDGYIYT